MAGMTEIEAAEAARELSSRLGLLVALNEHAKTNAAQIAHHRAEAQTIIEQLGAHLQTVGVFA